LLNILDAVVQETRKKERQLDKTWLVTGQKNSVLWTSERPSHSVLQCPALKIGLDVL